MNLDLKSLIIIAFIALNFSALNANIPTSYDPPVLVKVLDKDFPLFKDADYKILYLDFEILNLNIKSLRIVKEDGSLLLKDDVSDKSVDGIYEIDYTSYEKGKYRLELFGYNGDVLHSDFLIE